MCKKSGSEANLNIDPHSSDMANGSVNEAGQNGYEARRSQESAHSDSVDPEFEELRELFVGFMQKRIDRLQGEMSEQQRILEEVEIKVNDKDSLVQLLSPIISDAISSTVRDSRDEIIEALYPITGQLVTRAVSGAMADFVRRVDNQMRRTFSFGRMTRAMRARVHGVSNAEIALRDSLPFEVVEIFLIHRESGLLVHHISTSSELSDSEASDDADVVSAMLTAVHDFVKDAFGRGDEGTLEELHYGDTQIFTEAGKYTYIAVVTRGYEPMGYRSLMRDQVLSLEYEYFKELRDYSGDIRTVSEVERFLEPLDVAPDVDGADGTPKIEKTDRHAGKLVSEPSVDVPEIAVDGDPPHAISTPDTSSLAPLFVVIALVILMVLALWALA